jgi:hypothetical protein
LRAWKGTANSPRTLELPRDQNLRIEMSQLLGSLAVTTIPAGATILIDGKPRRSTPALFQLPAGSCLQAAGREGRKQERRGAVVIHDG